MRVLIIGSGPMGGVLMRLFGQSSEYDVSISEYNFAKTHHINIPNFSHVPLARFGWGDSAFGGIEYQTVRSLLG